MSEVRIEIATKNPSKVKAITEVFKIYFENVSSKGTEVISGVPDQPINEDVFKGAKNRIEFLKKNLEEHNYDYLVSCEGGLINMYGGWYNVQIVTSKENRLQELVKHILLVKKKFLKLLNKDWLKFLILHLTEKVE